MRRRAALAAIGLAPLLAQAQKPKRVVVLLAGNPESEHAGTEPFVQELRRAGWVDGRTVTYEYLYAGGSREKVGELGKQAASKQPDLIFAPTALAAVAATKATETIPVVFNTVTDPTVVGLAVSLARPGRNATGTFQVQTDLVDKRFEMLREALPTVKRVGVVLEAAGMDVRAQERTHLEASRRSNMQLSIAKFTRFEEVNALVARLKDEGTQVITIGSSFTLISRRNEFADLLVKAQIPLVAHRVEFAEAGAVMTYGADVRDTLRRAAQIAHRVLQGARPAETPIEQASKFELVINLRSARGLGITFPKTFLSRADRLIE